MGGGDGSGHSVESHLPHAVLPWQHTGRACRFRDETALDLGPDDGGDAEGASPFSYRVPEGYDRESWAGHCLELLEATIREEGPDTVLAFLHEPVGGVATGALSRRTPTTGASGKSATAMGAADP